MHYTFYPQDTCAKEIQFELDGGVVRNLHFFGGCQGNLQALSVLLEGTRAEDIIMKLHGNTCGSRDTSCADQLSRALQQALEGLNIDDNA